MRIGSAARFAVTAASRSSGNCLDDSSHLRYACSASSVMRLRALSTTDPARSWYARKSAAGDNLWVVWPIFVVIVRQSRKA